MKKIYSNVGKVLKTLAVLVALILAIAGIILGIVLVDELYRGDEWIGIAIAIASPFVAYLSSLLLYAFGDLVENTKKIAENTASLKNQNTPVKKEVLPES